MPTRFEPWRFDGQCNNVLIEDEEEALSGSRFLRVRSLDECRSLHQSIKQVTQPGDQVTTSIWVRPGISLPTWGVLQVRAIGDLQEHAQQRFMLHDDKWHCIEVSLNVINMAHSVVQTVLYFESRGHQYDLDLAGFTLGTESLCPQVVADLELKNVENVATMWPNGIASVGVVGRVVDEIVESEVNPTLYGWLSTTPAGPAIDDEWNFAQSLTTSSPQLASGGHYLNFPLRNGYARLGEVYINVATVPHLRAHENENQVVSTPVTVIPCEIGRPLCDIPQDYWARAEVEIWHDAEITLGCRGDSNPYNDRPFCPQQVLEASAAIVFLLKQTLDLIYG